jgi:hypothetical protein
LREVVLPIAVDDVLVLATDGVSSRFSERPPTADAVEQIAHDILHAYGRRDDDALVLVARYRGGQS